MEGLIVGKLTVQEKVGRVVELRTHVACFGEVCDGPASCTRVHGAALGNEEELVEHRIDRRARLVDAGFALRVKHEVLHRRDGEDVLTYIDAFTASWLRLGDEWEANRLHRLKSRGDLHDIGFFPFDFTDTLVLFMRWVLPREKKRFLGHDFDPRDTLLTDLEGVRSWIIASGEGESAVAVRRPYDAFSKRHLENARSEKAVSLCHYS